MIAKKNLTQRLKRAFFKCFFGVIVMLGLVTPIALNSGVAFAEPVAGTTENVEINANTTGAGEIVTGETTAGEVTDAGTANSVIEESLKAPTNEPGSSCVDSLGGMSWIFCQGTSTASEATDWLHDKIEDVLVINPVEMQDGKPIFEIWKYFRGVTNIVFIGVLLVVIFSQITGIGISNYGIKKILPKLIITAILINLSFVICSVAVDASNIIGQSLKGLFDNIQAATMGNVEVSPEAIASFTEIYASLSTGVALAGLLGGAISFEQGAMWLLIPVVLGALVSIGTAFITVAMRQAVVALLVMISPLAFVAYILPNTEQWFKKWKQLFTRMLVFYPLFSVLFGAANLAGWAIIASAKDGFWLILGMAVQTVPLIFSWKLMKMSGTFLGTVNGKLQGLMAKPLAANKAWADSHRQLTKQRNLARRNVYTPSLRLAQFLNDRKVARDEETKEYADTAKLRGQAYAAMRSYNRKGLPTAEGEEAYEMQARRARYQLAINTHKSNLNKGLGQLEAVKAKASMEQKLRLQNLDAENVEAFDALKMEAARAAKIDYDNTVGFYRRMEDARNAHMDKMAEESGNTKYKFHSGVLDNPDNLRRYNSMLNVMEGNHVDTNFIVADAAHALNAQTQMVRGKFADMFSYTAPTQDIVNLMNEINRDRNAKNYIDSFVAGLRVLNMRGDTDLAREQLEQFLKDGKIELGTYNSQSLANYLMFDVKGNDPFLRRFGKYINLETAHIYNEIDNPNNRRKKKSVDMDEYVNGVYYEEDENGNVVERKSKRDAATLLFGTSFKDIERTAIKDMTDGIRASSKDGNNKLDLSKFKNNEEKIWNAIMANIIGDQFAFLSGSEQIKALGKGLTGMNTDKHTFDWKGIFGDNGTVGDLFGDPSTADGIEKRKEYIDFMKGRLKVFLGGHVPSQISKSKTDILDSAENLLVFSKAVNNGDLVHAVDDDGNNVVDENGNEVMKSVLEVGKINKNDYAALKKKYAGEVKEEFTSYFNPDALKGFAKQFHKGYQGEAKGKLIELLDPESIYEENYGRENAVKKNNQRQVRYEDEDDEDDGMPVGSDDGFDGAGGPIFNGERSHVESSYKAYGKSSDVNGFWNSVKGDLQSLSTRTPEDGLIIDEIEQGLSQYPDTTSLYADIINRLFGGFSD